MSDGTLESAAATISIQVVAVEEPPLPPVIAATVLFADNFDDDTLDSMNWSTQWGSTITESSGIMQLVTTDPGPCPDLRSRRIEINANEPLEINRRVQLHYANEYFASSFRVAVWDGETQVTAFGVSYANYSYDDGSAGPAHGFYLFRNDANVTYAAQRLADASDPIDPVWDRWFDERLFYDPTTGLLRYFVDGEQRGELNAGTLPNSTTPEIRLGFSVWGWWWDHSQCFDDLVVTQPQSLNAPNPPLNAAPVISIAELTSDGFATDEDTPTNEILLEFGDADTPADELIVTVQSANPELILEEGIVLSGRGTTRTLVLTPLANQYGFATIVVSVSDGEQTTESRFELTVRPVNDVPTISELPELMIEEDATIAGFDLEVGDVETAAEDLVVTATSLAPGLIADEDIVITGSGADRHIAFRSRPDAFGEGDVLVEVSDGTDSQQILVHVTVLPVNDLPTISAITDQVTDEDLATAPISFTIGDVETDAYGLSITVSCSDPNLIAADGIVFEGSGTERSLVLTPAANQFGSATITVVVSDGEATVTREFVLTVNPVNDAPTVSPIANQATEMDTPTSPIPLTIGDIDNDASSLTLRAHSSNPTLVPDANIVFGGNGGVRTLTITPATNQSGSATITVTVSDLEVRETFTLSVLRSHLTLKLTGSQSLQLSSGADGRVIAKINGVANAHAATFLAGDVRQLTITGGTGANRIDLSAVQPVQFANLSRIDVDGAAGNDTLIGSGMSDSLVGRAANDSITGSTGNDTLDGGAGVDLLIESGDVNLTLTSSQMIGLGTDTLRNLETAKLTGGVSANRFDATGFTGTVTLIGNAGNDTLIGGSANDLLQGGDGADSIQGNAGNDIIDGNTGHDTLLGGDGNDTLLGAAGNDSLQGGLGNDVLTGGTGNDVLTGQGGADTLAGAGYGRLRDIGDRLTTDALDRVDEAFATAFGWADVV